MASNTLLSVKDLHVDFHLPNLTINALVGVNFDLKAAETLTFVGESGSGKSITCLSILRLLPYPTAKYPKGEIWFKDKNIMQMSKQQLCDIRGNGISMVFQEPMTSLNPLQTIYTQIAESILLHNPSISRTATKQRVLELLELVHLPRAKERITSYPHELSGGQRQRVVIAMALANNPEILIADEPTTALDVTVQQQILELLAELQAKFKMAMLFITHDFNVVKKISDRVCVMKDGQIVEQGMVANVLNKPQHPYTKTLLDSEVKGSKKPYKKNAPILLSAQNVSIEFVLRKSWLGRPVSTLKAVENISLSIRQGQTIGIVGESGSGKSTLGKAILQLLAKNTVQIKSLKFAGKELANLSAKQLRHLRKDMQVVFQDPFGSLSPRMTIGEIIGEGLTVHFPHFSKDEYQAKIQQAMRNVQLQPDMTNRYPHEFSGGQRQRIAIARAIILRPKFLLLDEPTSALDRNVQVQMVNLLRDLQQQYNLTYLFISHDLAVVRALSDYVMVMHNGKLVENGSTKAVFTEPKQPYTQNLIKAAFNDSKLTKRINL